MTHVTELKVRTFECDEYGHVNNAVYLNYLEAARIEFLEAAGFSYRDLVASGYSLLVAKVAIEYKRPLLPGDLIRVVTRPVKRGKASGVFEQVVKREETEAARAEVTWACIGPAGRPAPLPPGFDSKALEPD
jgi:YbgC/YbaW family acyl-CoA thioester hydrolase